MNRRFRALAQKLVVLQQRREELRARENAAVDALAEVVRACNDVDDKLRKLALEARVVVREEHAAGRITDARYNEFCTVLRSLT